jgi:hypothetical protein
MANRFEHEFRASRWQAVPAPAVDREVIRRYVERGRQLRSEAIRQGGRSAFDTVRRGLARIVTFVRCTALGLVRRPEAADCWRGSSRRA